jgi:hypothetical protein
VPQQVVGRSVVESRHASGGNAAANTDYDAFDRRASLPVPALVFTRTVTMVVADDTATGSGRVAGPALFVRSQSTEVNHRFISLVKAALSSGRCSSAVAKVAKTTQTATGAGLCAVGAKQPNAAVKNFGDQQEQMREANQGLQQTVSGYIVRGIYVVRPQDVF